MEGTIGEIRMFAGNFAPRSWALCAGQLLAISQFSALFSILGTTYGGDGRTTFALPDLRGRVPVGEGSGPGLSPRRLGEKAGAENVALTLSEMPTHNHQATGTHSLSVELQANSADGNTNAPGNNYLAQSILPTGRTGSEPVSTYSDSQDGTTLKGGVVSGSVDVQVQNNGSSGAHNNMQPFQCINFIICLEGIFPSRN